MPNNPSALLPGSPSSKISLGIGRGLRRPLKSPTRIQVPPASASCLYDETSYRVTKDIREENIEFVRDLIKKHKFGKNAPYQQDISEDFYKLTGNRLDEVALCLGFSSEHSFFIENGLSVKQSPESVEKKKKAATLFAYSEAPEHDYEASAKSIYMRLSDTELVEVQVDPQTCWISVEFLIKVFKLAGAFMADFCKERKVTTRQGFIPYEGLQLLRGHFYQNFTLETELMLDQLLRLLKDAFKTQNGYDLLTSTISSTSKR